MPKLFWLFVALVLTGDRLGFWWWLAAVALELLIAPAARGAYGFWKAGKVDKS